MILKQFYLGCLAHASCLIGDEQTGVAAAAPLSAHRPATEVAFYGLGKLMYGRSTAAPQLARA